MLKINLLPESKQLQRKAQRINILSTTISVIILGTTVLLVMVFGFINVAKGSTVKRLDRNISKTEDDLKDYKKLEDTVISLEQGLERIGNIINGGSKWSLFLKELEKSTPSDVRYLSIDIKDNIVKADLEGKDINSLARYVESLKSYKVKKDREEQMLFSDVSVKEYSKKGSVINFSANFTINKGALWQ